MDSSLLLLLAFVALLVFVPTYASGKARLTVAVLRDDGEGIFGVYPNAVVNVQQTIGGTAPLVGITNSSGSVSFVLDVNMRYLVTVSGEEQFVQLMTDQVVVFVVSSGTAGQGYLFSNTAIAVYVLIAAIVLLVGYALMTRRKGHVGSIS